MLKDNYTTVYVKTIDKVSKMRFYNSTYFDKIKC